MRTSIYVFCAFALFAATALAANTSVFVNSNDSNDSNKPIETIDAICINEVRITINTLVDESRVLKLSTHTHIPCPPDHPSFFSSTIYYHLLIGGLWMSSILWQSFLHARYIRAQNNNNNTIINSHNDVLEGDIEIKPIPTLPENKLVGLDIDVFGPVLKNASITSLQKPRYPVVPSPTGLAASDADVLLVFGGLGEENEELDRSDSELPLLSSRYGVFCAGEPDDDLDDDDNTEYNDDSEDLESTPSVRFSSKLEPIQEEDEAGFESDQNDSHDEWETEQGTEVDAESDTTSHRSPLQNGNDFMEGEGSHDVESAARGTSEEEKSFGTSANNTCLKPYTKGKGFPVLDLFTPLTELVPARCAYHLPAPAINVAYTQARYQDLIIRASCDASVPLPAPYWVKRMLRQRDNQPVSMEDWSGVQWIDNPLHTPRIDEAQVENRTCQESIGNLHAEFEALTLDT